MWFSVTYFLRGCIANRHTTSHRGGRVSKNGRKSVTYFLNGPLPIKEPLPPIKEVEEEEPSEEIKDV
jgi:hypothetical protein